MRFSFLTWVLHRGEFSKSRRGHFNPGEEPRYPLNRMFGRFQGQSGRFGDQENLISLLGSELLTFQPVA